MRAPVFRWNTNVSGWVLWVAAGPGTGSGVGTLGARSGYFRCAHPDFSLAGVRESGRPRYIYPGISCSKPCGNCGNRPLSSPTGVRDDRPRSSNPPPSNRTRGLTRTPQPHDAARQPTRARRASASRAPGKQDFPVENSTFRRTNAILAPDRRRNRVARCNGRPGHERLFTRRTTHRLLSRGQQPNG